jgi:pathogenesis-related protein 1
MKLSALTLLSLISASSVAVAAPVVQTIVETVVTTVIVQGQTQQLAPAPAQTQAQTTTPAAAPAATATPSPEVLAEKAQAPAPAPSPAQETTSTSEAAPETTSTSTSVPTSAPTDSSFQSQILNEHNVKRALHGVSALSWDSTLEAYAQAYADKYDCSGTLTHSGGQYGENLALGYTVTGSVDAWYDEGANYDYGSTCSVLDHFTQVVWKSTTKVGCGQKQCGSYYGTYIICSYDPAGNYIGECSSEVLPPV